MGTVGHIEMIDIVLLFCRRVGGGAGGERRQGDRGTDIAVVYRIPLSLPGPDQTRGNLHISRNPCNLSSPTFSLLCLPLHPLKHRSIKLHKTSKSKVRLSVCLDQIKDIT